MNLSFIGNLGNKDPELRFGPTGTPYCFFSVAMNTHKKGDAKNKIVWWNCVAFNGEAEMICTTFKKGQSISVLESSIELTPDRRNGGEQMQVKVWKASKPTRSKSDGDDSTPPPSGKPLSVPDEDVPF